MNWDIFFGLRHIWGDASCGTDYCNDTPTHFELNSGEPLHPKSNACGTADEMFENHMDYANDIIRNTFTINQGDRMEAVFANSPRRASLAISNAGLVSVTASNRIAFADCDGAYEVSEFSAMVACPKYRDISLLLNVEDKATAATVVSIHTGGTAVNGIDYQLMTTTLSFAAGDNYKPVIIRIFDDGVATGNKTINLSYSIGAGAGVTAGTQGQSIVITLVDDDFNFSINNLSTTVNLLTENFGTTPNGGLLPTGWIKGSFVASASTWTVNNQYGAATGFSADGRALHITDGTAAEQSNETAVNTYNINAVSDVIAITRSINTLGYKNIKLSFDYAIEGEAINGTVYDGGLLSYSITTQTSGLIRSSVIFQGTTNKTSTTVSLPADAANVANLWLGFEWINDNIDGANPPFIIDNIVVTGEAIAVETALSQSVLQSQKQGQTAQYKSNSNKIIATITNPNANFGCITAAVTKAGTTLTTLNTNTSAYLRSAKVISLTASVLNNTASYQATFYFTSAELTAWGTNVPNLKILKVMDGVDLASTVNITDVAIFTPTVDDQRATKGYVSFSINATGGFSQFLLALPTTIVPVSLLSFEAKAAAKNIVLSWSTFAEINNKGFVIERSTIGTDYEKIAWVDGKLNSSVNNYYQYIDNYVQPGTLYYYRLRQTDIDSREKLSEIRQAKIKGLYISATVSPNPAHDQVKVFTSGTTGLNDIYLLNAKGQLVRSWRQVNTSAAAKDLDISNLSTGVYLLQIISAETTFIEKLIIQ